MQTNIATVKNLTIGYETRRSGFVHILNGLDLTIPDNEIYGLIGESGSGKSTLALALFGYLNRECQHLSGEVWVDGLNTFALDSTGVSALRRQHVALVPQFKGQALNPATLVGKQLLEKLTLSHDVAGPEARDRVLALMEYVKLPAPHILYNRYPHQLSEGQHQRAVIAMALLGEPNLLVLDEPTSGLDVTTQAHILETLKEINEQSGLPMLLISHSLGVIAHMSDRVGVLYAGRLIEEGGGDDLFGAPSHPYTRGLLDSAPRLKAPHRRSTIPGQATLPGILAGCDFAPRCQLRTALCEQSFPAVEPIRASQHWVRCHHWFKKATTVTLLQVAGARQQPDQESLIRLQDVSISYHEPSFFDRFRKSPSAPTVVANLDLEVKRGETVALIGESGSGKSTIVKTIAGLHNAYAGRIIFDGLDLITSKRTLALRRQIQIIFQNPGQALNPRFTVAQMLEQPLKRYYPKLTAAQRQQRKVEILQQIRLGDTYLHRYPRELSNGEIQRIAIARAFIAEPELVLCDEVTAALDSSVQSAVLDLLLRLQKETACGYIFITHDLAVVRSMADRVAVLYLGRLCQIGSINTFFRAPYHPYSEALLGAILEPERGMIPRLLSKDLAETEAPARGCPFQNRCHHHLGEICDQETPPWQSLAGQQIRCHIPMESLQQVQIALLG